MRYTDSMKQELNRRVAACAAGFALPRYSDLPQVGLYLDQTVQFINGYFRDFPGVELTPSMVSNYVKKGIISHPVKKKYTREQLASLMYIAVSKTVLSMENIDALFQMQRARTAPPRKPTTTSATRWKTACPLCSGRAIPSGTSLWMPPPRNGSSAAPFWPLPTKCIWTASSRPSGRKKLSGRIFWQT